MYLTQLEIQRVRNLDKVEINPAKGVNLIFGKNASGKTSLLESIYLLSHARSFRTGQIANLIRYGMDTFQIYGEVSNKEAPGLYRLGLERGSNTTRIRINQKSVSQVSKLAKCLPVQVITPEAHRLLEQGPSQRRKYLDWGLFHVEHEFLAVWQQYQRVLKQRNAILRKRTAKKEVEVWNQPLIKHAEELTRLREEYLAELRPYIEEFSEMLLNKKLIVEYRCGWRQDESFKTILNQNIERDRERGFTGSGPHRAELLITRKNNPVQEVLSRGQQKLLVSAMRLAQSAHLHETTAKLSVILIDDLAAELDQEHRSKLLTLIRQSDAQVFLSVTEAELVDISNWNSQKMFHVEHGRVTEVV